MEVEIISREYIKPSSPTSPELKTHKLCLLDQFRNHFYVPRVLYYPLNNQHSNNLSSSLITDIDRIVSNRLQLLKQSLSETLVRFYPLAGKMTDHFSVDCNDDGVYFVEAVANNNNSPLNEFLKQPELESSHMFFPLDGNETTSTRIAGAHVAKVQVTSFTCGGIVICACISHMFGDGTTFSSFMKSWAAAARNKASEEEEEEVEEVRPSYAASILFPPNDDDDVVYQLNETFRVSFSRFCKTGRVVLRRFVFDAEAIAKLKAKATSSRVRNPTRIEAVSAVLSMSIMAVFERNSSGTHHKPTFISHAVNLRRKARPPLSEHLIGNIIWHTNALCVMEDDEVELDGLVCRLREAITKFDGDFVKSIQGSGGLLKLGEVIKYEAEAYPDEVMNRIMFSSWCNFGFYDIDFGWGKPIWVSVVHLGGGSIFEHSPAVILMDTRSGDGIEARVFLLEEDMALLEADNNILAFATVDPSPAALI